MIIFCLCTFSGKVSTTIFDLIFFLHKSVLLLLGTGERGGISLSHQFLIAYGSLLPDLYVSICFPGSEREQEGK